MKVGKGFYALMIVGILVLGSIVGYIALHPNLSPYKETSQTEIYTTTENTMDTEVINTTEATSEASLEEISPSEQPQETIPETTTVESKETTTKRSKTTTEVPQVPTTQETTHHKNERTVYITPTGKRYHYSSSCAGENAISISISDAQEKGYTPCKTCTKNGGTSVEQLDTTEETINTPIVSETTEDYVEDTIPTEPTTKPTEPPLSPTEPSTMPKPTAPEPTKPESTETIQEAEV